MRYYGNAFAVFASRDALEVYDGSNLVTRKGCGKNLVG